MSKLLICHKWKSGYPFQMVIVRSAFYLKVQGLSNYPEFHEGYILVDPTLPFSDMNSGDIIVVRKFDDATFKRRN